MNLPRQLSAILALLLVAGAGVRVAQAQATSGEAHAWLAYRDAYRAMVQFEKYGKPKTYLQSHLQVMARQKEVSLEGVQLTLKGKSLSVNLPLDAAGRAVFPLLKAAYDENAALVLNRAPAQYVFRRRVSIAVRPDGIYETAELRAACEQALAFARSADSGADKFKCVGVRFAFAAKGAEPGVRLRRDGAPTALPAVEGAAFNDDPNATFKIVNYRFGEAGQVLTQGVPVAIAPVFE